MHTTVAAGWLVLCAAACAAACSSSSTAGPTGGGSSSGTSSGSCPTDVSAAAGKTSVEAEGCTSCHGADMSGSATALANGADGITLKPGDLLYPPNLTPDSATGIGKWTDAQIDQAIRLGIDNEGQDLCPEMGEHYPNMCATEAQGIIAYLRSIPAVSKKVPGSNCPPLKSNP